MNIRLKSLIAAHKLFPISLKGDATIDDDAEIELSCVINFYQRSNLLRNILSCLREQDLPTEKFEVILVEDRGGTNEGRVIFEEFSTYLNLRYFTITENFGKMGYSRNFGLSKSSGRFILFLDDDTVILQRNFLSYLLEAFDISRADAIIPQGNASQCLIKGRYSFHDPHFPTNRCTAYRRDVLKDLGGFNSDITGQEDVEFYVRFIVSEKKQYYTNELNYLHPPLVTSSLNKAAAVGSSFARLRNRYPFFVWLMLLANGSRHIPFIFFPVNVKYRMLGKFGLGFILGVFYSFIGKQLHYN